MEENQELVDERIESWCQHLETRNTQDILTTLQDISNNYHPPMQQIDDKVQEKFRQLILHLLSQPSTNQILLNSSLRTYFHILHRAGIVDAYFQDLDANPNYAPFVLYAILSTDYHKCLEQDFLQEKCLQALSRAIRSNFSHLVPVLRAVNLLCKKYSLPTLDISLETFYSCLQSNRFGARDEALVLFRYSTAGLQPTVKLFNLIINYWPWTNKNKYYLLSVILTNHKLQSLSENCAFDAGDFFNGLRLGLSYKSTFSASQSLVRALSKQHNHELLELSTDILKNGTEREIVNFHTQWFTHILQKDELYRMMDLHELREVSFRYTFLVYLFSKQIVLTSKEMLNELANFLRNTSYQLTIETQMYVFRFFVDNLSALEFPNCLEYLSDFIEAHRCTECPQIRHMILGKFPTIFNFIAKVFCTLKSDSHPPVRAFFRRLIQMVLRDMQTSTLYQPLIFSLKAMDRILQILFSSSSKNVSKACKLDQNHKLGEYLVSEKIFDVHAVSRTAFDVLNSSECYDDARELVVNIIKQMKVQSLRDASRRCGECSESVEIDEVAQCRVFARLCIQCGLYNGEKEYSRELLIYSMRRVQEILRGLEVDPLNVCKNEGHIFGHMSVINEVLSEENSPLGVSYKDLLQMVEDVISLHLKLLNAAAGKDGSTAASFQVMDESLQLLVEQSSYDQEEAEDCRKFLMLSFWMALKTSCEVATTIGSIVMGDAEADSVVLKIVEKCLNASVTVLLRCRHKGAIEAAGVTLGKLIKLLTTHPEDSKCYGVVYKCLDLLFENVNQISTTRRGAGLTIMFLHLVKNEVRRERPLFHQAIKMLLSRIENTKESIPASEVQPLSFDEPEQNFDSVHALVLHYLCVIVKDTEIRDTVSEYYDEIMIAAILRIDNPEWIICNAALQLFGALVPKIVGQKQATEMSEPVCWEPTEVTFLEVALKLPRTCEHVLHICSDDNKSNVSTRKIILFLEFLSNVEHLHKGEESISPVLERFRELFWSLLSHACEKVRKLAATCFVRAHEFREDLPVVLLQLAEIIFKVRSENFFQGLLFALKEGIHKIDVEWKFTSTQGVDEFLELLRNTFRTSYKYRLLSFYTRALLVDFFLLTGLDLSEKIVMEIIQKEQQINEAEKNAFGFDLWRERVLEHKA